VIELAEIFRRRGPAYREKYEERMLPSHRRAMRDIESCRTDNLGGHVYFCPDCERKQYSYHSCKNRHCPKCQQNAAQGWLERQQRLRLSAPYFLLTFTLPQGLRAIARRNQKAVYNLLFRSSAAATQKLAQDSRFVGGNIGMIGVLHTWTRTLGYHPHVHYLVPGGGLSENGENWLSSKQNFFLPVQALSILFRAKFRDALRGTGLFDEVSLDVWGQDWVVHCQPVGSGVAALKYLAPYIFRVALSNRRIQKLDGDRVTYSYRDSRSGEIRSLTLRAEEFMRRFLQHVLPKGFVKVRYYGFFSPGKRPMLALIRRMLGMLHEEILSCELEKRSRRELKCPDCGKEMRWLQSLQPQVRPPPWAGMPCKV
jgi:hypothetical protein